MANNKTIATFKNDDYGIQAEVIDTGNGVKVLLKDTDADMYVEEARIFPQVETALAYAVKLVA